VVLSEVGKVTLNINGDEALSDESVLKSNGDKALKRDFSLELTAMKRLTLSKILKR
jgi:hypothetical protein